jgi:hypothetical protein
MNVLQQVLSFYNIYIQAFRLYLIASLVIALFYIIPVANSINVTANGYHLAILELEFYTLLLIIYNFRPARFKRVILKSYHEDPAPKFKKESFFWMVYLATLLILFGIPLLFFFGTFLNILNLVNSSNQFIVDHAGAWIPALFFLALSFLRLWIDFRNSIDNAKLTFARTFYILVVTSVIGIVIYFVLIIFRLRTDVIIILCLAFNAALLWTDIKLYLKARRANAL